MIRLFTVAALAGLVWLAGCSRGPTAPASPPPSIADAAESATLPPGALVFANRVLACGAPGHPDCAAVPERNLDLWRLDLSADGPGTAVRLTDNSNGRPDDPTCRDADDDVFLAAGPDGTRLFVLNSLDGDDDIHVLPVDGSAPPRSLTANDVDDAFVALSRDGATLYFANRSDGDADLYAVSTTDPAATPRPVLASTSDEQFLAVAGERAFYALRGPDGRRALFSRRLGRGRSVRLSPAGTALTNFGAVTPDGRQVLFDARRGERSQVLAAPTDGAAPAAVLSGTHDSALFRLLAPDGRTVVFTANDRPLVGGGVGDVEIFAVATSGGTPRLLTAFENDSYFLPRLFTPDGSAVLYESPVDGDPDIYRLPLDGGPPRNLTRDSPGADRLLGLAGDGLFVSRSGDTPGPDEEIFFLTPGRPAVRLTDNQVPDLFCTFLTGGRG